VADLKRYLTNPSLIAEGFFRQISSYSVFQNKSEFKVKVLTRPVHYSGPEDGDNPSSKWWFKGRITDINMAHEKFLPDPCDESIASDKELVDRLLAMHSTIYAEGKPDCDVGDIISAFIEPGDNNNLYDLQNLKFIKVETKIESELKVGAGCLTLSTMFDNDEGANGSSATPLGGTLSPPQASNKSSKFNKNIEIYRIIANGLLDNVLLNIRKHESGNNPNNRNFGSVGASTSDPPLTTLTFDQVRSVHRGGSIDGVSYKNSQGKNPFALGYYQIIPDTLDYVVGVLPELKDMLFNEENQHIAGTVLILDKRPKMGQYLLGENDDATTAGQHWAYEWAYAPSHYSISQGANGRYPKVDITPGMSYYSGAAGNKSGTTTTEIIKELQSGRTALDAISSEIEGAQTESPSQGDPPPSGFDTDEMAEALGY